MDAKRKLEEIFAKFPGIGPRQARRFVYYIQSKNASAIKEITDTISEVKKTTSECSDCHRFFMGNNSKTTACPICRDEARDRTTLMIVSRDSDFETVEKSGAYHGLYFILGGTVPSLDKEPEKRIRLKELSARVKKDKFQEVILSMNATPDGENTVDIVKNALTNTGVTKITLLGRGLSTGAELEYVDSETIKNALTNRH